MKFTGKNSSDKILVDKHGIEIDDVISYDDETGETEILLRNNKGYVLVDDGKTITATVILKEVKIAPKYYGE